MQQLILKTILIVLQIQNFRSNKLETYYTPVYSVNIAGCSFKYISRKGKLRMKHTSDNDKSYGLSYPFTSFTI